MVVCPSFTFEQIEQLTLEELVLREQAYLINQVNTAEQTLYDNFYNRILNSVGENGEYIIKNPAKLIDFEAMRNTIMGKKEESDPAKINELKLRDRAARIAKKKTKKILKERRMKNE